MLAGIKKMDNPSHSNRLTMKILNLPYLFFSIIKFLSLYITTRPTIRNKEFRIADKCAIPGMNIKVCPLTTMPFHYLDLTKLRNAAMQMFGVRTKTSHEKDIMIESAVHRRWKGISWNYFTAAKHVDERLYTRG